MIDLTQALLSVPASGRATAKFNVSYPGEAAEVQTNVAYVGGTGTPGTTTYTLTGTAGLNQNVTFVIGGNSYTYVGQAVDTTTTIAATNAAAALNASPAISGLVSAAGSTNTVVLTAKVASLGNTAIATSATASGTLLVATSAANLTGGTNNAVSVTSGVTTSFAVSYDGVNFVPTNVASITNAPAAGVLGQSSRIFSINTPQRLDSGNPLAIEVTVTNLDATYPAVVSILTEKQA